MNKKADKKKTPKPSISQKLKYATNSNQEFLILPEILGFTRIKIWFYKFYNLGK